jgi:phospholipid transport system substrate-binding protein
MPFRRFLLAAAAALPVLAAATAAQAQMSAQVSAADAKTFINQAGQKLVTVVNSGASESQKADQLRQLVDQIVAVDQVGDYVLGRYINVVTPAQHSQYLALFHQLLSYNITYQIKAYQGVSFTVNSAAAMGNDMVVDTTISRPGQADADVGWAVDDVNGSPKIVDVIVAGTSLRITERNDYASVVTSHGGQISALLTAMQSQIDRIKSNQ